MKIHPLPAIRRIAILKADRIIAHAIQKLASKVFPQATVEVFHRVEAARLALGRSQIDLLLTGIQFADGDSLELVTQCCRRSSPETRVLVVSRRKEPRILASLRDLPLAGVFDPTTEGMDEFVFALRTIASGGSYWSPDILEKLRARCLQSVAILQLLTCTEQLILASVGDGSGNAAAARLLGLHPSTIQSVRRSLHKKLRVRNSGELVRSAAQMGFVHFTSGGAETPGLSLLRARWQDRRQRRASRR